MGKFTIDTHALARIDTTKSYDELLVDVVVPLRGRQGATLGDVSGRAQLAGVPLLAKGEPELDERGDKDQPHPFARFTVSVNDGSNAYPVEVSLPLSRNYGKRVEYRTRPMRIEPSSVEESEVVRDKDGQIVSTRRLTYPSS